MMSGASKGGRRIIHQTIDTGPQHRLYGNARIGALEPELTREKYGAL